MTATAANPLRLWTVALDFDGTIAEFVFVNVSELQAPVAVLAFRPGAEAFIRAALAHGIRLVLHSCRCSWQAREPGVFDAEDFQRTGRAPAGVEESWRLFEEMRSFLQLAGVWDLFTVWQQPGKPLADIYVDDRGAPPDFVALAAQLGVVFADADGSGGHPPMGVEGALAGSGVFVATPAADAVST